MAEQFELMREEDHFLALEPLSSQPSLSSSIEEQKDYLLESFQTSLKKKERLNTKGKVTDPKTEIGLNIFTPVVLDKYVRQSEVPIMKTQATSPHLFSPVVIINNTYNGNVSI
jgi:hypothetical protein